MIVFFRINAPLIFWAAELFEWGIAGFLKTDVDKNLFASQFGSTYLSSTYVLV